MREIKFRGKRVDNGEWVIGSLVMVCNGESLKRYPCIVISYNHDTFDWHEVIPETIGQFTGLTDKNGKEIFEGDILRLYLPNDEWLHHKKSERVVSMEFLNYEWYLRGFNSLNGNFYFGNIKADMLEIIGNIHDNPELIRQQ